MTNFKNRSPQRKSKPRGILQPNKTLPAKIIAGDYLKYTMLILWIFLSLIPWDSLYGLAWYRSFVEFMAGIYPNIATIPSTPSQFPEYAMGLLAFCGAIGPFFIPYYLVHGVIHVQHIELMKIQEVPILKMMWFITLSILFFIGLIAYLFRWNGYNFYLPNIFYESKYAFSLMTETIWIVTSLTSFGVTGSIVGVIKSYSRKSL